MTYRYGVAVVGVSKNLQAFHADKRGNFVGFCETIKSPGMITHHSPDARVYWAESKEAAEAMARDMTEDFPGYSFVTFEASTVYCRPPGPMTAAVFSDKGLLPQ